MYDRQAKLYERLGLDSRVVDPTDEVTSIDAFPENPAEGLRFDVKFMLASQLGLAALRYYLREDQGNSRDYAQRFLDATSDYYLGSWRETTRTDAGELSAAWWRATVPWIEYFRWSLGWAAVLGEWGKLGKLASYPTLECPSGDGGDNERMYYVAVAKSIVGRDLEEALGLLALLSAGRSAKFTLLAALEAALLQQDAGVIQSRFHEYLSYFAKKVLFTRSIERVSCEATFYFYRASRIGVSLTVERRYSDFVMRLSDG